MKNNLIIKETDINWLEIIEMAFKRKGWGKTHTMYVCDDTSITCAMYEFRFSRNVAVFKIQCNYPEDDYYSEWEDYVLMEYHLSNFSLKQFKLLVLKKIRWLITNIVSKRTSRKAREEFASLQYYSSEIDGEVIEEHGFGEDYENIQNIEDEDLQESCMDSLNDKILDIMNRDYCENIISFEENNNISTENLDLLLKKINELRILEK